MPPFFCIEPNDLEFRVLIAGYEKYQIEFVRGTSSLKLIVTWAAIARLFRKYVTEFGSLTARVKDSQIVLRAGREIYAILDEQAFKQALQHATPEDSAKKT